MARARILSVSHADGITLSATSEAVAVSSLQSTDVREVWRSSDLDPQRITAPFGSSKNVNCIYLGNVNATQFVLQLSDDNFSTIKYAEAFSKFTNALAYDDAILFLSGSTGGDYVVDANGDHVVDANGDHVIDTAYSQSLPIAATHARIMISDPSVTDSYYEIGRLKIGEYFDAPNSRNVGVGPSIGYRERGQLIEARGGNFVPESKTPRRVLRVFWEWVHPTDAYTLGGNEFAEMMRVTGHRDDVVLSVYPGDASDKERLHTILGFITDRSDIDGRELIKEGATVYLYSSISLEISESI